MKNYKTGFATWPVIIVVLVLLAGGVYLYQQKPTQIVPTPAPVTTDETADWEIYSDSQLGIELRHPANIRVNEIPSDITVGFANEPILISSRLALINESHANFEELINDLRTSGGARVKILGDVSVGSEVGSEVLLDNRSGAWLIHDGNLYTFYFNKTGNLDALDRQILSTFRFTR